MGNVQQKSESSAAEKTKKETKEPEKFKVILLNDDFTTMDFVIEVLVKVFAKDVVSATRIMREVHRQGSGIAGIYTYDIARTKADEVHKMARSHEFPLKCIIEKA